LKVAQVEVHLLTYF